MSGQDLNDLFIGGAVFSDIESMIEPMDLDTIHLQMGKKLLEGAVQELLNVSRPERLQYFNDIRDRIPALSCVARNDPEFFDRCVNRIATYHGCKAAINEIKTLIDVEVSAYYREQQEKEAEEAFADSDPETYEGIDPRIELKRKEIKEKGIVVAYGDIYSREENFVAILSGDRRWKGRIEYDEFSEVIMIDREPMTEAQLFDIGLWIQRNYEGLYIEQKRLGGCVRHVSMQHKYHPVRERLLDIYARRAEILQDANELAYPECLFPYYFQTEDTPLNREYGTRTMISAIKRVMEPGCKADSMPVLISKQGTGKSQGIERLAMGFSEDTAFDIRNKDAVMMMKGTWIYELAEAQSLLAAGQNSIKGFITSRADKVRLPYDKYVSKVPRGNIFMCTTNDEQLEFLSEPSGSRRYWAMLCAVAGPIRLKELSEDVEALWCRAMTRYMEGDTRNYLDERYAELSRIQNTGFAIRDIWEDYILRHLQDVFTNPSLRNHTTVSTILLKVLNIDPSKQNAEQNKRVLRILRRFGCKAGHRVRSGDGDQRIRRWEIPEKIMDIYDE